MPNDTLAAHARRTVRAFLRKCEEDDPEVWEFWKLIYGDLSVDHETAVKVEAELADSTRTVQDVLDGWRPEALANSTTEPGRPWHAGGCPGDNGCTCGGGLTHTQFCEKLRDAALAMKNAKRGAP